MKKPRIAVVSFPGTNGDTENLRTLWRSGFDAFVFHWNRPREDLADVDGYFFGAGFSYEDRGRSGMVAGRDPLMLFMIEEAARGKVVIGNCNGAQILVESGLIPLDRGLKMSLARNAIHMADGSFHSPGFLNEWVWITRTCAKNRCVTGDWDGAMHIPIAHGEGRFTTKDKDVLRELRKNDQLAFSYCDANGKVSEGPIVTPNGSAYAIAGVCNPAGNVVALMPHPERTTNGDPYFASIHAWLSLHPSRKESVKLSKIEDLVLALEERRSGATEIFIDTIIVNNEERTVEQALRRKLPAICLKQLKYIRMGSLGNPAEALQSISFFNPHKEIAFVRRQGKLYRWNHDRKQEEQTDDHPLKGIALLRRDEPDTGAGSAGEGSETGVCYVVNGVEQADLERSSVLNIFHNPHASTIWRLE